MLTQVDVSGMRRLRYEMPDPGPFAAGLSPPEEYVVNVFVETREILICPQCRRRTYSEWGPEIGPKNRPPECPNGCGAW